MEFHVGVSPLEGVRCLSHLSRQSCVERNLSYRGRFVRSWWCRSGTFVDEGYRFGFGGCCFDFVKGKLINTVEG
jgi:hypothetical protein